MSEDDAPPGDATPLEGRLALVVGAETVTGAAIALALGAAGADVALAVMRPDEGVLTARRLQRELRELGRRAMTYAMDVTLGQNVKVTTRQVAKELGGLDLVVSAPDDLLLGELGRTSDAQLAQTMTANAYAHAFVARASYDEFRHAARAHLLLVTHALAVHPQAGVAAYALAGAATLALVPTMAAEHPGREAATVGVLRGATMPGGVSAAELAGAIAEADAAEAHALGALAVAIATRDPAVVSGRVFSALEGPEGAGTAIEAQP